MGSQGGQKEVQAMNSGDEFMNELESYLTPPYDGLASSPITNALEFLDEIIIGREASCLFHRVDEERPRQPVA